MKSQSARYVFLDPAPGVGLLIWGGVLFLTHPGWAELLILLAALLVVPLLLRMLHDQHEDQGLLQWVLWLQLPAGILLVPSFLMEPGIYAGLLCVPWVGVTGLTALAGLRRFIYRERRTMSTSAMDIGLMYFSIGGGWLLLSRLGISPIGFQEPIILLTGAHFHYAGLMLPILVGMAAERLPGLHSRLTVLGVISGVPFVAVGITVKHLHPHLSLVEAVSAWYMCMVSILVVALQIRMSRARNDTFDRTMDILSAMALLGGMALAGVYALGMYLGTKWLDIPTMLVTHALLNSVGFALPAVLAWSGSYNSE